LVSKEKGAMLQNYLENMHKTIIRRPNNNTETYLGISKSKMLNENMSETLAENVTEGFDRLIPKVSTHGITAAKDAEIKSLLMGEFGYTENNARLFIDNILHNKANETFTYARSGKEVQAELLTWLRNSVTLDT
jgi:hypothetical protein